jgi:DNA-binding response OmpR family regulator
MLEGQRELRVLAVDDDGSIRLLLADVLEEAGCRVFTAPDGAEAMDILEEEPVDLLITDYHMPRMNGLDLIRRSRERYPQVAAIMMTGDTRETVAAEARKSGAYRILLKPFAFEELLLLVGNLRGAMLAA